MKAASWSGLAGLLFLLVSCSGSKSARLEAQVPSKADKEYPAIFCNPPGGLAGIGFSPLGRYSSEPAHARAAAMACRLLAWSTHVRVKGERLFEQIPGGALEFRGENIELLEVPEVVPEACRLETLEVVRHAWIVAVPEEGGMVAAGACSFSQSPPAWIAATPRESGWLFAVGSAAVSFRDEPGSWDLATYHALVELAFSVKTRTGALQKSTEERLWSATVLEVDTELRGFQIAARWRDRNHVYVLGKVPSSRAVSHLADGS